MRNISIVILIGLLGMTVQVSGQTTGPVSSSCPLKYDSILNRSYYTIVDSMPMFKGGHKEMIKTIKKNLKWPGGRCDIEGTVFVVGIVEVNGQLTNKRILKGLSNIKNCDADGEALRVVDFMTTWIPGQCDGKVVPVQYVIPILFRMVE